MENSNSASICPTYFISHGSPDIVLRNTSAAQFLKSFKFEGLPTANSQNSVLPTASLPNASLPNAILVISAHWMTEHPMVTAHPNPSIIYDFGGFPEELYHLQYPAIGSPQIAQSVASQLQPVFPLSALSSTRGLDHGAWMPLFMMYPQAKIGDVSIPVLQLSIQPHQSAVHHYEVGKQLKSLRAQGVLIIASGNATHNLREAFSWLNRSLISGTNFEETPISKVPQQVQNFNNWLYHTLSIRDDRELLNWQTASPNASFNHPTPDHILPLFVVLGATSGEEKTATRIHQSYDYGVLSMDSYKI